MSLRLGFFAIFLLFVLIFPRNILYSSEDFQKEGQAESDEGDFIFPNDKRLKLYYKDREEDIYRLTGKIGNNTQVFYFQAIRKDGYLKIRRISDYPHSERDMILDPIWGLSLYRCTPQGQLLYPVGPDNLNLDISKLFPVFPQLPVGKSYISKANILLINEEPMEILNQLVPIDDRWLQIRSLFRAEKKLSYNAILERKSVFDLRDGVLESSFVTMVLKDKYRVELSLNRISP